VVFNTGMTGYQEVLTDPSYAGQLITFTYPELGNTGVNQFDMESQGPAAYAVICRQLAPTASNWRSNSTLHQWLQYHGVVGLSGIDSRALVRHLRERGAMNGAVSSDGTSPQKLHQLVLAAPSMEGLNLAERVSTRFSYSWDQSTAVDFDQRLKPMPPHRFRVVAIDFGIKRAILERLASYGCELKVMSADSSLEQVLAEDPEGVFLSNGPGDPAAVHQGIELARGLLQNKKLPLFGICLGHQILGLALGGRSFKLGYGHRGLNHPCGAEGVVEITSQNHGFALEPASLDSSLIKITHHNLNDGTVAAFELLHQPVIGVQYHPEASPGPHDADHHFARFVALMAQRRSLDKIERPYGSHCC
jgi:carbamoyl-phosphate synthase small subunit